MLLWGGRKGTKRGKSVKMVAQRHEAIIYTHSQTHPRSPILTDREETEIEMLLLLLLLLLMMIMIMMMMMMIMIMMFY